MSAPGLVEYVKIKISEDDLLSPYLHKRKNFEHEQEVRTIIQKPPFHISELKDNVQNWRLAPVLEKQ